MTSAGAPSTAWVILKVMGPFMGDYWVAVKEF